MAKQRGKMGEYAILAGAALAAIYILNIKPGGEQDTNVAEKIGYDVTKKGLQAGAGVVGGTVGAVGEGYSRGLSVFGVGGHTPPGTTEAVTVSTADERLPLDFTKKSQSRVPDVTRQLTTPDWLGNTTVYLPSSQPVVEQVHQQLRPGQGYLFTQEEQSQFDDPYGDLLWEQYSKKTRR